MAAVKQRKGTALHIAGQVVRRGTRDGVADVQVEARHANGDGSALVTSVLTDDHGDFHMDFDVGYLDELVGSEDAEVFFRVFRGGEIVANTEDSLTCHPSRDAHVVIEIGDEEEQKERRRREIHLHGRVRWADNDDPVSGATLTVFDAISGKKIGRARSDKDGAAEARLREATQLYAVVSGRDARQLASTQSTPVAVGARDVELQIDVDAIHRPDRKPKQVRPKIELGQISLDARAVAEAEPEVVLDVARAHVGVDVSRKGLERIKALSLELLPDGLIQRTLCGTSVLTALRELMRHRGWPRDLGLELEDVLTLRGFGYTSAVYDCPNFRINYFIDGPAAVNADTSSQDVVDPGLTTVLATLPAGAPPTYVKRVCFWLERALANYISPPASLRNPAAAGKIPVYINTAGYGSATPTAFYLNNALNNDLLCAVTVHELFHMVQFQYTGSQGSGTWVYSMMEGGAVWAEDTNTEMMNRYLDEAGTNFNGVGVQDQPQQSLESAGYKCSLFWRYLSEQQSAIPTSLDEPLPIALSNIGRDVYRPLIEACEAGSWSADDLKGAIRALPWYQDFYDFGYLDAARQDLMSSETLLGNYVLACYLKDLDEDVPDRRFDFMEGQETIYMDEVIAEAPQPGDKLASVALAGTGTLTPTASVAFSSTVSRFSSRYYEVIVDPAVTSVQVQYASSGITSGLVQIAAIDEDGHVREIYRRDTPTYTKQFANLRDGKRLVKIMIAVSGASSSGSFSLSVNAVAAAPDVMVTRWHSLPQTEYEIDSRNWAWTWVSPDVWVDNDGDGVADGAIFFNFDNQLHIQLHNKGNANATGIGVSLWYQDASGGLSPTGWLPVQDTGGTTQMLTGLTLAAGATNDWVVNWSPAPSGMSHHFCIKAVVTIPGDPNTDNKRVLSNFGNVQVRFGHFIDIDLIRRNIDELHARDVKVEVVPRLRPGLEVARLDLLEQAVVRLAPGEERQETIRVLHRPLENVYRHKPVEVMREDDGCGELPRLDLTPDPLGQYAIDERTLPPGLSSEKHSFVTVVQTVDGLPQGGATFLVELEDEERDDRAGKREKR
jgi:hypothetical protein